MRKAGTRRIGIKLVCETVHCVLELVKKCTTTCNQSVYEIMHELPPSAMSAVLLLSVFLSAAPSPASRDPNTGRRSRSSVSGRTVPGVDLVGEGRKRRSCSSCD